jgi:DNA polymerase/3'-5' exonuclease PolX
VKTKMPLAEAERIGRSMVNALLPLCERVELAGSIRRRAPFVGDIEIVAIPKQVTDMFGAVLPLSSDHALNRPDWSLYGSVKVDGSKQKKILLLQGIQLDLFIVTPPAQWGVQFLLRTGPADYSHKMVTARKYGGCMPSHLRVQGGAVWSNNHVIPTPEESDVYTLFGLGYVPPEMRK